MTAPTLAWRVWDYLRTAHSATPPTIAQAMGVDIRPIADACRSLARHGHICRTEHSSGGRGNHPTYTHNKTSTGPNRIRQHGPTPTNKPPPTIDPKTAYLVARDTLARARDHGCWQAIFLIGQRPIITNANSYEIHSALNLLGPDNCVGVYSADAKPNTIRQDILTHIETRAQP